MDSNNFSWTAFKHIVDSIYSDDFQEWATVEGVESIAAESTLKEKAEVVLRSIYDARHFGLSKFQTSNFSFQPDYSVLFDNSLFLINGTLYSIQKLGHEEACAFSITYAPLHCKASFEYRNVSNYNQAKQNEIIDAFETCLQVKKGEILSSAQLNYFKSAESLEEALAGSIFTVIDYEQGIHETLTIWDGENILCVHLLGGSIIQYSVSQALMKHVLSAEVLNRNTIYEYRGIRFSAEWQQEQ